MIIRKKYRIPTIISLAFLLTVSLAIIGFRLHPELSVIPGPKLKTALLLESDRAFSFIRVLNEQATHSEPETNSRGKIHHSITAAVEYLITHQLDDGQYTYWYDPLEDFSSPSVINNILRQTATTWSILRAYKTINKPGYLLSAEKSLSFILKHTGYFQDSLAYVAYDNKAKLGGIALAVITLLEYRSITSNPMHDGLIRDLLATVFYLQDIDEDGSIESILFYHGEYDKRWESMIYPGEALLALSYAFRYFRDPIYLNRFHKTFSYYNRRGHWKNHGYIAWACQALAEMHELTGSTELKNAAYQYCKRLLKQQNLNKNRIYYGSFYGLPSINTTSCIEGVGSIMQMALAGNDMDQYHYLYRHYMAGLQWISNLQYTKTESRNFPVPEKVAGGFRYDHYDPIIRIDYVQHAICAMLFAPAANTVIED